VKPVVTPVTMFWMLARTVPHIAFDLRSSGLRAVTVTSPFSTLTPTFVGQSHLQLALRAFHGDLAAGDFDVDALDRFDRFFSNA
jgi:hypothetical protein